MPDPGRRRSLSHELKLPFSRPYTQGVLVYTRSVLGASQLPSPFCRFARWRLFPRRFLLLQHAVRRRVLALSVSAPAPPPPPSPGLQTSHPPLPSSSYGRDCIRRRTYADPSGQRSITTAALNSSTVTTPPHAHAHPLLHDSGRHTSQHRQAWQPSAWTVGCTQLAVLIVQVLPSAFGEAPLPPLANGPTDRPHLLLQGLRRSLDKGPQPRSFAEVTMV